MGMFGGGDNNNTNDLLEDQIRQNQAELERKRKSLYEQRFAIIKSQGGEVWEPNKDSPLS